MAEGSCRWCCCANPVWVGFRPRMVPRPPRGSRGWGWRSNSAYTGFRPRAVPRPPPGWVSSSPSPPLSWRGRCSRQYPVVGGVCRRVVSNLGCRAWRDVVSGEKKQRRIKTNHDFVVVRVRDAPAGPTSWVPPGVPAPISLCRARALRPTSLWRGEGRGIAGCPWFGCELGCEGGSSGGRMREG